LQVLFARAQLPRNEDTPVLVRAKREPRAEEDQPRIARTARIENPKNQRRKTNEERSVMDGFLSPFSVNRRMTWLNICPFLAHKRLTMSHCQTFIDQSRTNMDHCQTNMDQSQTNVSHCQTNMAHCQTDMAHICMTIDQSRSTLVDKWSTLAQCRTDIDHVGLTKAHIGAPGIQLNAVNNRFILKLIVYRPIVGQLRPKLFKKFWIPSSRHVVDR
jgi:hypothetical protein